MANKKISQLNKVDGAVGITSQNLFPIASGVVGTYQTASVTAVDVASYCLSPMPVGYFPGNAPIGFTGTTDINFSKTNWDSASTIIEDNPYLQVRMSDGQLVTGSGVAVPAALGDDMGDCVATDDITMQGNDITGLGNIGFGNVNTVPGLGRSIIAPLAGDGISLKLLGYQDLILSGNRHVSISGQGLDLASTPISGNVTITGGDLEIDPGNKLIVNEISGSKAGSDGASITIEGSSRHVPTTANSPLSWADSNIQYDSSNTGPLTYAFTDVADGQTLTMYLENTHPSNSIGVKFVSGTFGIGASGAVVWGGEYPAGAPSVEVGKANVYTFVRINTGIFASAVTGYVY